MTYDIRHPLIYFLVNQKFMCFLHSRKLQFSAVIVVFFNLVPPLNSFVKLDPDFKAPGPGIINLSPFAFPAVRLVARVARL